MSLEQAESLISDGLLILIGASPLLILIIYSVLQ